MSLPIHSLSPGAPAQAGDAIPIDRGATSNFSLAVSDVAAFVSAGLPPGNVAFSLNGSSSSVSLVAGNNVSLASNASTITIGASNQTSSLSYVSSLNGSSGLLSISAGAGIGIGQAGSTITVSASVQTSSVSMTALGNTTSSSAGTFSNLLNISGAGIASVGVGAGSITISAASTLQLGIAAGGGATSGTVNTNSTATFIQVVAGNNVTLSQLSTSPNFTIYGPTPLAAATQSLSGGGTSVTGTAVSFALVGGNNISLASASGAGSLTLTINASSNALNNVSLLNGSSGALSVSAGAGIGVGQANSTLTISASNQTSSLSYVQSLNGSSGQLSVSAGAGIGIGQAGSTITVSASVQTSSLSLTALGNTTLSSSGTASNLLNISGAGGVSVGVSNNTIYISGGAGNFSLNGSSSSVSLVNGTGVSFASNASTITIAAALAGGAGVSISTGAGGPIATILTTGNRISLTQNLSLGEVAGTITSASGTVTGSSGFGSSLFLQRIFLPAQMNLSEIDAAMSIGFNATSNGAGTMSRSFVLYSFGNSTSLASVVSASGTSAWTTGTSTAGGSASLTQFQGGWSSPLIQPFVFASSSVPAGDYVVGQIFNFAQASSTWTVNLYGAAANSNSILSAATNLTSATLGAMSSGGLMQASAITNNSTVAWTAFSATPTVISALRSAGLTSFGSSVSFLTAANSTVGLTIGAAVATNVAVSGLGAVTTLQISTLAGSYFTNSSSYAGISNAQTSAYTQNNGIGQGSFFTASGSLSAVTNVALGALSSSTVAVTALPNFGFIGTGSTTSNFPTAFIAGIMSTGAVPTSIAVTSTAVTYSGSFAFIQPWFLLAGV